MTTITKGVDNVGARGGEAIAPPVFSNAVSNLPGPVVGKKLLKVPGSHCTCLD